MSNLVLRVGKSEYIYEERNSKKSFFQKLFSKPSVYSYHGFLQLEEKGNLAIGDPQYRILTPKDLGETVFNILGENQIFEMVSLQDSEKRGIDRTHGVMYGIPLDADELKEVILGYNVARESFYQKNKVKTDNNVQEE